jgi:hypothetical protein
MRGEGRGRGGIKGENAALPVAGFARVEGGEVLDLPTRASDIKDTDAALVPMGGEGRGRGGIK